MTEGLCAAILAGGLARRMGGKNKALINVAGQTILDRQLATLAGIIDDIAVVARGRDEPAFAARGLTVLTDPPDHAGCGPVAGILAALAWSLARHTLVLACDMPDVRREVILLLAGELSRDASAEAVVPVVAGKLEPLCAIYGQRAVPKLASCLAAGQRSARTAVASLAIRTVDEGALRTVDPSLSTFRNINTPESYPPIA